MFVHQCLFGKTKHCKTAHRLKEILLLIIRHYKRHETIYIWNYMNWSRKQLSQYNRLSNPASHSLLTRFSSQNNSEMFCCKLYLHWPAGSPVLCLDCPPAHRPCTEQPSSPHCEQEGDIKSRCAQHKLPVQSVGLNYILTQPCGTNITQW